MHALVHHVRQFPGEVHGIANAGIHALTADRTVDVCGIAEEEGPPSTELHGDAVMDVVGREPVHLVDIDVHLVEHSSADVIPRELMVALCRLMHDADETCASSALERKHRQKVCTLEIDVNLAVHRRSRALDVGHVEDVIVSSARKADPQFCAHG